MVLSSNKYNIGNYGGKNSSRVVDVQFWISSIYYGESDYHYYYY